MADCTKHPYPSAEQVDLAIALVDEKLGAIYAAKAMRQEGGDTDVAPLFALRTTLSVMQAATAPRSHRGKKSEAA